MRKWRAASLTMVAVLAVAGPASAGGVNFAWGECLGEGGRSNMTFDCTASTEIRYAVGSFMLNQSMPDLVSLEIVVDVFACAPALPAWWTFSPSPEACRDSSLTMSFDFSGLANASCADPFGGLAVGGLINYSVAGNRARALGIAAIPPDEFGQGSVALEDGKEYYGFRLGLKLDRATGPDACEGCATKLMLVLNSINAVGLASNEFNASPIFSQAVQWQGGSCWPVAAQSRTWGQIKGLYRRRD